MDLWLLAVMTFLPARVRGPIEAQEALDKDLALRKKELSNLRSYIRDSDRFSLARKMAIILSYAHIEGALKHCFGIALLFVNFKALPLSRISPNLRVIRADLLFYRAGQSGPRRRILTFDEFVLECCKEESTLFHIEPEQVTKAMGVLNGEVIAAVLTLFQLSVRTI